METVSTLILALAIIAALYTEWYARKAGIVPMPTLPKTRRKMLAALPENPEGTILELGSGWGSTLIALSKKYPTHTVIGYEMAPLPFYISKLRLTLTRRRNVTLKKCDFMREDFTKAGAVFCYLSFKHMDALEPKFQKELSKGCVVVSHAFPLPKTPAQNVYPIPGIFKTTVYAYAY